MWNTPADPLDESLARNNIGFKEVDIFEAAAGVVSHDRSNVGSFSSELRWRLFRWWINFSLFYKEMAVA